MIVFLRETKAPFVKPYRIVYVIKRHFRLLFSVHCPKFTEKYFCFKNLNRPDCGEYERPYSFTFINTYVHVQRKYYIVLQNRLTSQRYKALLKITIVSICKSQSTLHF